MARGWEPTGSRPRVVKQTRYDWVHVIAAVCPQTGKTPGLISPHLNTQAINAFFDQVAKEINPDLKASRLIRDRDEKFVTMFDDILNSAGIEITILPVRSPNLNAHMERFVQTIKHECLSHFVILGHRHLNYLVTEFVDYYHKQRPHQSKGNKPLLKLTDDPPLTTGEILCEGRLGGLLKHYHRKAA